MVADAAPTVRFLLPPHVEERTTLQPGVDDARRHSAPTARARLASRLPWELGSDPNEDGHGDGTGEH
jgi:hypothetical protein